MGTNEVILVVEDEPDAVILLKRALEKAQVRNPVVSVDHGERAIAYLNGDGEYADRKVHPVPTLMIMDLKLPRRTGLEVLGWIRQHPQLRVLPVIVLTSSRDARDVARAYEAGANSYLVKPISYATLVQMMESVRDYWLRFNEPPVAPRSN
jgi:CheY-like chemotaxis protein